MKILCKLLLGALSLMACQPTAQAISYKEAGSKISSYVTTVREKAPQVLGGIAGVAVVGSVVAGFVVLARYLDRCLTDEQKVAFYETIYPMVKNEQEAKWYLMRISELNRKILLKNASRTA